MVILKKKRLSNMHKMINNKLIDIHILAIPLN